MHKFQPFQPVIMRFELIAYKSLTRTNTADMRMHNILFYISPRTKYLLMYSSIRQQFRAFVYLLRSLLRVPSTERCDSWSYSRIFDFPEGSFYSKGSNMTTLFPSLKIKTPTTIRSPIACRYFIQCSRIEYDYDDIGSEQNIKSHKR